MRPRSWGCDGPVAFDAVAGKASITWQLIAVAGEDTLERLRASASAAKQTAVPFPASLHGPAWGRRRTGSPAAAYNGSHRAACLFYWYSDVEDRLHTAAAREAEHPPPEVVVHTALQLLCRGGNVFGAGCGAVRARRLYSLTPSLLLCRSAIFPAADCSSSSCHGIAAAARHS
eukprot:SAG25_NODE_209_length_11844_cov_3.436782_2_plen_173_part_00